MTEQQLKQAEALLRYIIIGIEDGWRMPTAFEWEMYLYFKRLVDSTSNI